MGTGELGVGAHVVENLAVGAALGYEEGTTPHGLRARVGSSSGCFLPGFSRRQGSSASASVRCREGARLSRQGQSFAAPGVPAPLPPGHTAWLVHQSLASEAVAVSVFF